MASLGHNYLRNINMFAFLLYFSTLKYYTYFKSFFIKDKNPFMLHNQYHCCWWPHDTRSQGISSDGISNGIHSVLPEHSELNWKTVHTSYMKQCIIMEFCFIKPRNLNFFKSHSVIISKAMHHMSYNRNNFQTHKKASIEKEKCIDLFHMYNKEQFYK